MPPLRPLQAKHTINDYALLTNDNKYRLQFTKEYGMQLKDLYKPVRILSFVVLALMLVAALYAFTMTGLHWTGISV